MPRTYLLFLLLISTSLIGCGYLDTELAMTDEEFEGSMGGIGGIGMSGVGWSSGCGGAFGLSRSRSPRLGQGHGEVRSGAQQITLGDLHIYGRRGRSEAAAQPVESNAAVDVGDAAPVDWVGHFDEVSKRRQNELIAAWVEGQLVTEEGAESPQPSDLVDARGEVEIGQR